MMHSNYARKQIGIREVMTGCEEAWMQTSNRANANQSSQTIYHVK
jgi:hypothetical protein